MSQTDGLVMCNGSVAALMRVFRTMGFGSVMFIVLESL